MSCAVYSKIAKSFSEGLKVRRNLFAEHDELPSVKINFICPVQLISNLEFSSQVCISMRKCRQLFHFPTNCVPYNETLYMHSLRQQYISSSTEDFSHHCGFINLIRMNICDHKPYKKKKKSVS